MLLPRAAIAALVLLVPAVAAAQSGIPPQAPPPEILPNAPPAPAGAPEPEQGNSARVLVQTPAPADTPSPAPLPQAPPVVTAEPPEIRPLANEGHPCLLRSVWFAPTLTVLSLPNMFGAGLRVRVGDYLGFSFDYQMLPGIRISKVKFGTKFIAGTARVYPLAGKLFIGAGLGYQRYDVNVRGDINWIAAIGYPLVLVNVGMMGRKGFVFTFDGGLVVPLTKPRTAVHTSAQGVSDFDLQAKHDQVKADLRDALDKFPPVSLQFNLRVGYAF